MDVQLSHGFCSPAELGALPRDPALTPGSPSSVAAVPGAGGRHRPGPEPRPPRGLPGLRVRLPAGRRGADQAPPLLLRHLDGRGGRAHLLVSVCLRWAGRGRGGGRQTQRTKSSPGRLGLFDPAA